MYEKLPQELKERGAFCLWRYEQRNGDNTKVPYQISGLRGDSTNRAAFTDFTSAVSHRDSYDGTGIGVFGDICAIDIDHCVENGTLSDMAKDIIARMDSYTEYSPSGNGVRILFKAALPAYDRERYYINNRRLGLEVYVAGYTNRFVTVTGDAIKGSGLECRPEALEDVLERYMRRPEKAAAKISAPGSYLSDASVLKKASSSKQAEKFNALWNGQVPEGKSHSEADAALCAILAFWCGGDLAQMDRLFRQSGLYREKWEREDYRMNTLQGAIGTCADFYKPAGKSSAADDFNDLGQAVQALTPAENNRYPWNDIGNGRLFADVFKGIARYVPERKQWFIYDGTRWVPDTGALKAMELCKDLADAVMKYALCLHDEHKRKSYIDFCRKWQSRHVRITILNDAQSVYPISMEDFDSDKYLFNCTNGTIDLRTMEFREHNAEDKLTKIAPVDYMTNAESDRLDRFIREIMSGDMSKARFLQKSVGYSVSGDTRFECMFFLYGATTRNGKGTLMESILRVMGDYGKSVRAETLAQKHNPKDMSRLGRDYLQVGMYTEIVFPNNDIRFIAINNGVDSINGTENDMTPFINIFNEFYAKDTSRKIKAVFNAKGNSGKPLTTNPPYGYLKDPEDKNHWLIDEEAAPVVRDIFKMCVAGKGPSQIAKELRRRGIPTPAEHYQALESALRQNCLISRVSGSSAPLRTC